MTSPEGRVSRRRRRTRFRIAGVFDGARVATVVIERTGDPLFTVRPYRRRRVFQLPLSIVARGVIYEVVKAELSAKKRERGRR